MAATEAKQYWAAAAAYMFWGGGIDTEFCWSAWQQARSEPKPPPPPPRLAGVSNMPTRRMARTGWPAALVMFWMPVAMPQNFPGPPWRIPVTSPTAPKETVSLAWVTSNPS
jgi:hypothetical protein